LHLIYGVQLLKKDEEGKGGLGRAEIRGQREEGIERRDTREQREKRTEKCKYSVTSGLPSAS
jgi:hypothetical protein